MNADVLSMLFADDLPDEIMDLQLVTAFKLATALEVFNLRSAPRPQIEVANFICDVDRLD